jgi:hypothetical protein
VLIDRTLCFEAGSFQGTPARCVLPAGCMQCSGPAGEIRYAMYLTVRAEAFHLNLSLGSADGPGHTSRSQNTTAPTHVMLPKVITAVDVVQCINRGSRVIEWPPNTGLGVKPSEGAESVG